MEELKKLIGSQILKIEDNKIKMKKDDNIFYLKILSDSGNCCGYSEFELIKIYDENNINNPIITDIMDINYPYSINNGECVDIIFYGENNEIAKINGIASSQSGYSYGACVILKCEILNINIDIVKY